MASNLKYDTADLWRKDRDHVIHPWADFAVFKDRGCMVIAESEGAYVYDSDGNQYLDGIGGQWCVNIGYGQEEMAQAVADQIRRLPYYSVFGALTSPPAAELAAKLAQLAPGSLNHTFFGTGGSMANETAIRIIHFYFNRLGKPNKKKIISRIDAYHGSSYLTGSLTGVANNHIGFDLVQQGLVHHIPAPNSYRRPSGMSLEAYCDLAVGELEGRILELGPENVACFIAEPIMGAGGVLVPPPGYQRRTKEVCARYGVIYISDEVVTAFGRLGHMIASKDLFDLQPDVLTLAKGISSGYVPLSATVFSDEIHDVISVPQAKGALFTHGFTYSGHPVSCAAGLKNIEIMERLDLCAHVRDVGDYFENQLDTLRDLPLVGDVRGKRFMMCVENVADQETKVLLAPEVRVGARIAEHCQRQGVIVRPLAHLNVISPPLTMTRPQVDRLVETMRIAISSTMADLVHERLWSN